MSSEEGKELLIYKQPEYDRKILCQIPLEAQYTASVKVEKNPFAPVYDVVLYTIKKD